MTIATETEAKTIKFAVLAALALGAPLEGGTFQAIVTLPNGSHVAVALLPDKPAGRVNHGEAKAWAESVGGVLPTRPIAAQLYANAKSECEPDWYWTADELQADTGDEDSSSYAWDCYFNDGDQGGSGKSYAGCARAVRLIHIID